jgi:TRAP-type C4-dicarboxylate transport system permease small subunit
VTALDRFSAVCAWTARAAVAIAATGLVIMMAIIAWQVFGRFVLNDSPSWSEPLAILLMMAFILLAAAVGVREGFHLGISWGVDRLPERPRRLLRLLADAAVGLFGLLMAAAGVELAGSMVAHRMPALGLSRSLAYLPMVLTGGLFLLFSVERIWVELAGATAPETAPDAEPELI